jgi:hypothetical protein
MKKIYPSNFALPQGSTTKAVFNSGCPRYQAYKHKLQEEDNFDELHKATGRLVEELVFAKLTKDPNIIKVEREVSLRTELGNGVFVSGRADFIVTNKDGNKVVYEVKSTLSRYSFGEQVKKGIIRPSHLGQLLTYLGILGLTEGVVWLSYVHFNRDINQLDFETREWEVKLDGDKIYIDGELAEWTGTELMRFYKIMYDAHTKPELPPKTSEVEKACMKCPLYSACENNPKDRKEYADYINNNIKPEQGGTSSTIKPNFKAKIQHHNIKLEKGK